jgi:transketolase
VSDGDLMEGISHEAASLAGHLKLGKMVYLWDNNRITIDGSTDLSFTEDVLKRFESYGWHTLAVDGHDRVAIEKAVMAGIAEQERPTLISCRTCIGFGSPNKAGSHESHGAPLGVDEVRATKLAYGFDPDQSFFVSEDVYAHFAERSAKVAELIQDWEKTFAAYKEAYPELAAQLEEALSGRYPQGVEAAIPVFPASEKGIATRKASQQVIQAFAPHVPTWVGGSADLTHSTLTFMEGMGVFSATNRSGRNLHYGVREHGMAAAMNGMALHGGVRPFGATFLVFSDYCKPSIRLAALMKVPVTYVFTHDSIGLGEDGPTHQPVEHLLSLRSIPNNRVIRPADANETAYAWIEALKHTSGPTCLVLTRQNLPVFERPDYAPASLVSRGGYILYRTAEEMDLPHVILIATGSEVSLAMKAAKKLEKMKRRVSVVSMPCRELFEQQSEAYRESVLPSSITARVIVEAGVTTGWERIAGARGKIIGINHFGASAPYEKLYEAFGITEEAIVEAAEGML